MGFLATEMKILTNAEAGQIHDASLKILKNIGFKVRHERMLKLLRETGADVDFNMRILFEKAAALLGRLFMGVNFRYFFNIRRLFRKEHMEN